LKEGSKMTHEEFKKAADHWKSKDAAGHAMEKDKLIKAIEDYIRGNNTCALATGEGTFIRCTPIEYAYRKGDFWMFTEGGEKFIGLEKNKNVCLAIYDKYENFGDLKGMQVVGKAEVIEPFSPEYIEAADYKKIPLEALKKLPETMNLLKIVPLRVDFLNTDFKKEGYSSRQELILG
jgi:hypothetical protein